LIKTPWKEITGLMKQAKKNDFIQNSIGLTLPYSANGNRVVHGPHSEVQSGPHPKSKARTRHLFLKPDSDPEAKFTK